MLPTPPEGWFHRKTRRWLFEWPQPMWVNGLVALGALIIAFHSQYVFGFQPCELCIWQRYPLVGVAVLCLSGLVSRPSKEARWLYAALIAALFAVAGGLALFHTGVEQHWWEGLKGCAAPATDAMDPAAMRAQLLETITAQCDKITWTFLGISMASWNVPFSLLMFVYNMISVSRLKQT